MSFSATIQATLTANNSQFSSALDNSSAKVKQLEANLRRAGAMPLPGERSARDSGSVFEAQARTQEKITQARYRAMDAASAEESAIRSTIRAREDTTGMAATSIGSSSRATGTASASASAAPGNQGLLARFSNWRKNAKTGLEAVGGADLVKGLGIGALVAGFSAVLNNAQQVRDAAYAIGGALDPAVARTAALADTLDRAKQGMMGIVAGALAFVQRGVDYAVAGVGAALGYGSIGENIDTIDKGNAAEDKAKRDAATKKENLRLLDVEAAAKRELAAAEAEVADARINAAKEAADTEGRIAIATIEVKDAQDAVTAASAGTTAHYKAQVELINRQGDLLNLQKQREAEISSEKEKQVAIEEKLSKQRDEANQKLTAALQKQQAATLAVQSASQAYATALSDQSAATLTEVTTGQRGSPADQRKAAEVERLRAQARIARDQGRVTIRGGQAVSVADELSSRANQVQGSIQSLSTSERDPLAAVTQQLVKANEELATIRESLTLLEVQY